MVDFAVMRCIEGFILIPVDMKELVSVLFGMS